MLRSVCVVANQRPFPPFHGANADIWRIMQALRYQGIGVDCISWKDSVATSWQPAELAGQLESYLEFDMHYTDQRLRELARTPAFENSRRLSDEQAAEAVDRARDRGCDAVLVIGLYGGKLGGIIAKRLGLPLYYRSQAIETEYYRHYYALLRQHAREGGYYSAYMNARHQAELRSIAAYERHVMASAKKIFEISSDDLRTRALRESPDLLHLPPLAPTLRNERIGPAWTDRPYDIGYLGNLFMPNNQKGLRWFVREVIPIVRKRRPKTRILITGKLVDPKFLSVLLDEGVDVMPNPPDAHESACSFKVGVNPIFEGNGTTVKTIDLLWAGCGVVATPIGVQGYGFAAHGLPIRVATNPEDYATACLDLLHHNGGGPIRDLLGPYTMEEGGARLAHWMKNTNETPRWRLRALPPSGKEMAPT